MQMMKWLKSRANRPPSSPFNPPAPAETQGAAKSTSSRKLFFKKTDIHTWGVGERPIYFHKNLSLIRAEAWQWGKNRLFSSEFRRTNKKEKKKGIFVQGVIERLPKRMETIGNYIY